VTGGASGIGLAIVRRLAAGGASVALLDLNAAAADQAAAELRAGGSRVTGLGAHCLQLAVRDMIAGGWGRIVTISSSSAQSGSRTQAHYSAAKGGVMVLTKTLALELPRRVPSDGRQTAAQPPRRRIRRLAAAAGAINHLDSWGNFR
jgi:NAD(P)-dependent dehydrogenase (short-subunit alcohol dehydrogenase family)